MSKQQRSLDYLLHLLFIQSCRLLREKKARMVFGPQDQKGKPSTRQRSPATNSFQQSPLRHYRASNCQTLSKLRNRLTVENSRDTAAVLARPQVHRSKLKTLHTTSRALDLSWHFTDSTAEVEIQPLMSLLSNTKFQNDSCSLGLLSKRKIHLTAFSL